MPYLSSAQRAFVVEVSLRTGSYVTVQRESSEKYFQTERVQVSQQSGTM